MIQNPTERLNRADLGNVPEGQLLQVRQWRRGSESVGSLQESAAQEIALDVGQRNQVAGRPESLHDDRPQVVGTILQEKTEKNGTPTGAAAKKTSPTRFGGLRLIRNEIRRAFTGRLPSGAEGQNGLTRRTTAQRAARAA